MSGSNPRLHILLHENGSIYYARIWVKIIMIVKGRSFIKSKICSKEMMFVMTSIFFLVCLIVLAFLLNQF
ncbi:MAG: hypothetical protein COV66_05575 [Nitrospinae bacterium CG11_big_fil_rev_8_21_14_0_20_45_15]|nr:MAG: hypothetical protein COV66_05575 [Nitrospinae bacterium CG11_big_fil_rev_8_21_14_0_20_45_15]